MTVVLRARSILQADSCVTQTHHATADFPLAFRTKASSHRKRAKSECILWLFLAHLAVCFPTRLASKSMSVKGGMTIGVAQTSSSICLPIHRTRTLSIVHVLLESHARVPEREVVPVHMIEAARPGLHITAAHNHTQYTRNLVLIHARHAIPCWRLFSRAGLLTNRVPREAESEMREEKNNPSQQLQTSSLPRPLLPGIALAN